MAATILLVHGMGTHPKGEIITDFKKALNDAATRFGIADKTFMDAVGIQEFNYSGYLDVIRNQFANNAQAQEEGFSYLDGLGFAADLVEQLTNFEAKFGKDKFFYTHLLDVLLYGTMYFGEKIRIDFIKKFDEVRTACGHANLHVICHSLGTAVVHDALAKYYRVNASPFDGIPDLKTGNFNIGSLWTIANVSRLLNILNGLTDPYDSTVRTGLEGCTDNFINVRHEYDPFTWFKTYEVRGMNRAQTIENKVICKPNTHDFYEYVTNPNVSRVIFDGIYGQEIGDGEFDSAVEKYNEGSLGAKAENLVHEIEAAKASEAKDSLEQAVPIFKEIQGIISNLSI